MRTPRTRLLLAIAVTLVAWASAFVVVRGVAAELSAGPVALGRLLVGTVALGIVALVSARRWVPPTAREWLLLALFGIVWFGAYTVVLNLAESTLDAGTTAMIVGIGPILIAVGAGLLLREGLPRWLVIGAGVAFAGVVLIGVAGGTGDASGHPVEVSGVLWALAAAATYASGVLLQKPVLRRLPGIQVTFLGCGIGAVACLPFAGALVAEASEAPVEALAGVVFLGIVPTAIGFLTWAYALARTPAGRLGVTTYVVPPLVVVMGLLAFGEIPVPLAIAGGAVCLLGVGLSRRRGRDRRDPGRPDPVRVRPPVGNLSE